MPKRKRKRGRPRKVNVERNARGRVRQPNRREREDKMRSVALEARMKHTGLPKSKAADPLCATPYGLLFQFGDISLSQLGAAETYLEATERAYRLKGITIPHPASVAAKMVSTGGLSLAADPEPADVHLAWNTYHRLMDVLMQSGRETGTTRGVPDPAACKRIVHSLCFVMDRDVALHRLSSEELGNFRSGLNAIHNTVRHGR